MQRGMRKKTIKAILGKKVKEWLMTIEDGKVAELAARDNMVSGGAIASLLLGEKVNDLDIYFTSKEATLAVAKYYVEKFAENPPPSFKNRVQKIPIHVQEDDDGRVKIVVKSAGIASEDGDDGEYQYFEGLDDAQDMAAGDYVEKVMGKEEESVVHDKPRFRPVFLSSNAITLSDGIQIVIRFYGKPDEIHTNYDFDHCKCAFVPSTGDLILPQQALEALLARELIYSGSKYPLCSIIRTRKFLKRGWVINAGQYLKMVMQLNAMDLTKIEVLEDQLIGVDVAYFQEVIDKLKQKDKDKVDQTYLMNIIDRMF